MIRVLHVVSNVSRVNGIMSVVMNYYTHIDKQNFQFDFLCYKDLEGDNLSFQNSIENLGGEVFFFPSFVHWKKFNYDLKKMLEERRYKIVHIHDAIITRFIYNTLKKCGVDNIIVHSHATKWSDKLLNGIRNKIVCLDLSKYVDYKFACSVAAGNFMFGENSDFYLMKNAIDVDKFKYKIQCRQNIREKYCLEKALVIGHVGNFVLQKNHRFIIDIFEECLKIDGNCRLLLIGDGSLKKDIEDIATQKNIKDKIIFTGKISDVEKFYSAMDVFILPSKYEGLPMVGVEAQCNGLPVLFSDKITREADLKNAAYLSIDKAPKLWAQKIIKMFQDNEDNNRYESVAAIIDKGFDFKSESIKLEKIYESMLKK